MPPPPQLSTIVVSGVLRLTAKWEVGVPSVPLCSGKAWGSFNSRTTRFRRPLSSCISWSRRSTSGFRAPADGSKGVGWAQAGGPAVEAPPAGNCSPGEVVFRTEVADGADLDTGGFLKESGWLPGANVAAWGTAAVVDAKSGGEPANATRGSRTACGGSGAHGPEGSKEGGDGAEGRGRGEEEGMGGEEREKGWVRRAEGMGWRRARDGRGVKGFKGWKGERKGRGERSEGRRWRGGREGGEEG